METSMTMAGDVRARVIHPPTDYRYMVRNRLRPGFWKGWLVRQLAEGFSALTGVPCMLAELSATLIKADGTRLRLGTLSYREITDTGVAFLVDDWDDDTTDITTMKFHACGTDTTAEDQTDTALIAESTTITDRATGVQTQPEDYQLRSVGTQAFTGSGAITEHGLFSVVTESSGVMWDRSVFAAINVADGDSIQWTYTCTITAGG